VATANPEDYTNRGRIITPLKDRFGAQIRTHYPKTLEHEIAIVEQEQMTFEDSPAAVRMPGYMKEIVAEITHLARRNPQVNQRSGVSVRVSIANYENLVSNALRRAIKTGEKEAVPRISDLPALIPSSAGKLELETWEENDDSSVLEKIIRTACSNVFRRHFTVQEFSDLVQRFDRGGFTVEVSDHTPSQTYETAIRELPGVDRAAGKLEEPSSPATRAAVLEFLLEGLHLSKRLNKTPIDGSTIYGG
jgi:magnesium chelatase subunit I